MTREELAEKRMKELVLAKDALYHENVQLKFEIRRLERQVADLVVDLAIFRGFNNATD